MAVELAVGYVSIIPETSKIAPTLAKALGGVDKQFDQAGRSSGNRFSEAMSTALSTAGGFLMAKAAMAIGGAVGTAITKGITRYTQIENAEKKLSALGNSAQAISRIMEGANKAVRGTAFGMGEAADVAAAAVASGIKPGTELDRVLRTIANSAAIAGMDMKSMGAIFNKAAASGKVQGDILAQLGDAGVPAVQWLAKELGVTAAQVYKMGEDGKITFAQFEAAMRKGMDPNAAVMMGDTLTGMWANSQAALGRLGAEVMKVLGPMLKNSLAGSIERVDALTKAIGPALQKVQELAGPVWLDLKNLAADTWGQVSAIWRTGGSAEAPAWLTGLVTGFRDLWDRGVALSKALWDLGVALAPIAVDAAKVVAVIGGGILLVAWEAFKAILDVITPLISGLAGIIRENQTAVEILGGAILVTVGAYKAAQLGIAAYNAVMLFGKGIQQAFTAATYGQVGATYAVTGAQKLGLLVGNIYNGAMKVWTGVTWLLARAQTALGVAIKFAMGPIGLIITGITLLVGALIYAYNHNETFRRIVDKAWAGIKTAIGVVVDWVRTVALPGLMAAWEGIKAGVAAVGSFFVTTWTTIQNAVKTAWDFLTNLFFTYTPLGILIANWQPVVAFFTGLWNGVVSTVTGAFNAIAAWVMPWVTWFQGVFAAAWGVFQFLILLPIRLAQIAIEWAWGKITEAFWAAWAWVSGVFMANWNFVTGLVAGVVDAAKNWISVTWQQITDRFWAAWSWVSGVFMAGWNLLVGWLSGPIDAAKNWIANTWNLIIGAFTAAWNWVAGVFMTNWRMLTGLVGAVMDSVRLGIDLAWQWITRIFTDAWNWVSGTFRGWWGGLVDLMRGPIDMAKGAIDQILGGIRNAFEQAVNFIRDTWARVKDAVAAPVKIAIEIGNKLIGGFRGVAEKVGLKIDMPDIPPLPAYAAGTNRVPGSRSNGTDSTLAVTSSGMPIARVDPGEGIVRFAAMRLLDRNHPGAFDYINRTGSLPGFATGGRVHPVPGWAPNMGRGFHGVDRGLDIPAPMGTPVVAMRDGRVLSTARWNYSYGWHIRTSDGAVYAHLSDILVNPGQEIRAGQVIGKVGTTGNSRGPHLHVTAYDGASPVGAALGAAMGAGQAVIDWVGDLKDKFAGPLKDLGARVGDSPFGQVAKKIPNLVADGMVERIKKAVDLLGQAADSVSGAQSTGSMDANAGLLMDAGKALGASRLAMKIALMTAAQESSMGTNRRAMSQINGDGDVGWFQQRATRGDGAVAQLADPLYALRVFLRGVNVRGGYHVPGLYDIKGWESMRLGDAAQRVQVSAFPRAYDKWESNAERWLTGRGYWRGTESARPGLAVVGEQGRELIDFGRGGQRVFNNTETEQILSGKAKEQTVIQIQGNVGWNPDEVAEQIAKRQRRARVRAGLIGVG